MIQINIIWILCLIVFLLVSGALILLSRFYVKDFEGHRPSYLKYFPYEYYFESLKKSRLYSVIMAVFAGISFLPIVVVITQFAQFGGYAVLDIIISCIFGLSGFCFYILSTIEAKFVRPHTLIATIYIALALLTPMLTAVIGFSTYFNKFSGNQPLSLICGILAALLAICAIILAFNSKLKNWAQLESITDSNGDTIYSRPNKFPLAYTEWACFLIIVISNILFYFTLIHF